jgi:hypothetical protein
MTTPAQIQARALRAELQRLQAQHGLGALRQARGLRDAWPGGRLGRTASRRTPALSSGRGLRHTTVDQTRRALTADRIARRRGLDWRRNW